MVRDKHSGLFMMSPVINSPRSVEEKVNEDCFIEPLLFTSENIDGSQMCMQYVQSKIQKEKRTVIIP